MVRYLESRVELSLCERRSGVFRTALTGSSQLPPADRCSSAKTKQKNKNPASGIHTLKADYIINGIIHSFMCFISIQHCNYKRSKQCSYIKKVYLS